MPELLLEIRSEEIPARMQARAAADLKRLVSEGLTKAGLEFESAESYVTPRRLALVVQGLPLHSESKVEEKKGPKVGAPEQAIQGFMKANGLSDISEAELRDTDKGQFYFLVREVAGRATRDVIAEILRDVIFGFPWPKSMRWGEGDIRWVRPIQGLLVLFDGTEIVHDFGSSIRSGTSTLGHRFLAPEPFEVTDFADYKEKLRAAKVMLDPAERRATIAAQADEVSRAAGLTLLEDPALLDEVAGLVEWPRVLLGRIDRDFMELPPEVLTVSMRAHQKYFALNDSEGRFAANFLVVANMDGSDELHRTIVAGNERVLRARLADAQFFWDQDRKATLQSRVGALKEMVFHEKLGSLEDKVDRVTALAVEIARHIDGAETDRVRSAARLCKADLTTGMVGEFPELQGVMGRYYALKDGEHYEVASAIAEHYAPLGPKDRCPAAPVSVAVALADKIDTLVGFWAIDEKPTGSKDPYALRRAALGVIRIILENELRLPLRKTLTPPFLYSLVHANVAEQKRIKEGREFDVYKHEGKASGAFGDLSVQAIAYARMISGEQPLGKGEEKIIDDLLDFFADRLKVTLRDRGVRHDLVAAVFALGGEDDLVRLHRRVDALQAFLASEDGANLLTAHGRAANILRIEEKKDGISYRDAPDPEAFEQDDEKALHTALEQATETAEAALEAEDFAAAMAAMARLRAPVDAFFDHVTVNAEDASLRENRLKLLSGIVETLNTLADFSRIEG